MKSIWEITDRNWLALMCHGYIDSNGRFTKVKLRALDLTSLYYGSRASEDGVYALREAIESIRLDKSVTKGATCISRHGPYAVYTAKSIIAKLSRHNHSNIGTEITRFFDKQAKLFDGVAFDGGTRCDVRSIDQMYVLEVNVSNSTKYEDSGNDATLRYIVDGIDRLTQVQSRLTQIYPCVDVQSDDSEKADAVTCFKTNQL